MLIYGSTYESTKGGNKQAENNVSENKEIIPSRLSIDNVILLHQICGYVVITYETRPFPITNYLA